MDDSERDLDSAADPRLRPIIARLQEIGRKCRSLGPRNEEAVEMARRLDAVIAELSEPSGRGASPPRYAELARQLFPVARLFESLGFLSVAKEVAHVDRLLTDLDPGVEHPARAGASTPPSPGPTPPSPPGSDLEAVERAEIGVGEPHRQKVPLAVIVALIVLAVAAVAAVAVVLKSSSSGNLAPSTTIARTRESDAGTESRPEQSPSRPKIERSERPSAGPRSRLGDLIGDARLAQQAGDLDEAISLLSEAGSIDPKASSVLETAADLVDELVTRSDRAAAAAEWQSASDLLERARELAVRFELSTAPIDNAVQRQGTLERVLRLQPEDESALRDATGSHAVVVTDDRVVEGRLEGLEGGLLRIELDLEIGDDGALIHTVEVPLSSIREVRVYPER